MSPIASALVSIINVVLLIVVASVILSWLVAFNVINIRNPTVRQIYVSLERFTSAILDPIRRFLPSVGGLDFSPIVAIIGLQFLQNMVVKYLG